jgi:hypothetical protein
LEYGVDDVVFVVEEGETQKCCEWVPSSQMR